MDSQSKLRQSIDIFPTPLRSTSCKSNARRNRCNNVKCINSLMYTETRTQANKPNERNYNLFSFFIAHIARFSSFMEYRGLQTLSKMIQPSPMMNSPAGSGSSPGWCGTFESEHRSNTKLCSRLGKRFNRCAFCWVRSSGVHIKIGRAVFGPSSMVAEFDLGRKGCVTEMIRSSNLIQPTENPKGRQMKMTAVENSKCE